MKVLLTVGVSAFLTTASAVIVNFKPVEQRETFQDFSVIGGPQNDTNVYYSPKVVYSLHVEQMVQESVDWVLRELKSFLNDIYFDFEAFDEKAYRIKTSIFENEVYLQDIVPDPLYLSEKVLFCKKVFQSMYDASESLKFYNMTDSLEQAYVCKIIQLHVSLFALYDSYGSPDPTVPRFAKNVKRHKTNVRIWEGIFSVLADVPLSVRTMFEAKIRQVKGMLDFLSTYIHD